MMRKRTRGVPLSRALLEVFIDDDLFLEMSLIAHMWTCLRKQVRTWNTAHTHRERKLANVTWQQLKWMGDPYAIFRCIFKLYDTSHLFMLYDHTVSRMGSVASGRIDERPRNITHLLLKKLKTHKYRGNYSV